MDKVMAAKSAKCFLKMLECDHKMLSCVKAVKCFLTAALVMNTLISVGLMCCAAKK